ncbi:hypothetical protein DHW03_12405 [Pedobacter yonginense]|uniref:DUF4293 domain-containing protein n=1 Tax=Pedobacter yonginense TaxID=651869 RepID=A0A317EL03_9SPHI|nr:DUF4293 domain-containing protein [Pedobacter yonginense]PWS26827.1 hypothetical protein DHW03_12405 [Pedobacter yonginense]
MIQRIQSIWLFLATLTLALMLVLPIATKQAGGSESTIFTYGIYHKITTNDVSQLAVTPLIPLAVTNIAVAVMCFVNIFNFKRRSLQKKIIVFTIAAIAGFAFWCSINAQKMPGGLDGASFGVGAYLPALAILFCVLAIFGINKDERLIRSAERLR